MTELVSPSADSARSSLRLRVPDADEDKLKYRTPTTKSDEITPQMISDFDHARKLAREELCITRQPIQTIKMCCLGFFSALKTSAHIAVMHPSFIFVFVPFTILWVVSMYIPGPHRVYVDKFNFAVEFVVWWTGLGILSSVGLGSGLQSGVLFMFPHIFKVCLVAQTCKNLNFDSDSNMWFRQPDSLFKCVPSSSLVDPIEVTFFGLWKKIILVCFFQAAGTAIGEIPPYYMTRAARLAAEQTGYQVNENDVPEEIESKSKYDIVNKFKHWMVGFLKYHGFYGVLFMASFPNIAFDFCGICCGHFLMPFNTFFMATFLGKAIVRNSYQSVLYVAMCSEQYMEYLIKVLQSLIPDSLDLDHIVHEMLAEARVSFQSIGNGEHESQQQQSSDRTFFDSIKMTMEFNSVGDVFMFWWKVFMTSVLAAFMLSCITQFAQYYQLTLDQEASNELRSRLPRKVLKAITSPVSGRLKLPIPSTLKKLKSIARKVIESAEKLMSPRSTEGKSKNKKSDMNFDPDSSISLLQTNDSDSSPIVTRRRQFVSQNAD